MRVCWEILLYIFLEMIDFAVKHPLIAVSVQGIAIWEPMGLQPYLSNGVAL